jgi:flagellar biogenesis protein FliO
MLSYRVFGLGHMGLANALGMVTLALVAVLCYLLMRAILHRGRSGSGAA